MEVNLFSFLEAGGSDLSRSCGILRPHRLRQSLRILDLGFHCGEAIWPGSLFAAACLCPDLHSFVLLMPAAALNMKSRPRYGMKSNGSLPS